MCARLYLQDQFQIFNFFHRRNKRPRCPLDNLNFDPTKVRLKIQYIQLNFFPFSQRHFHLAGNVYC